MFYSTDDPTTFARPRDGWTEQGRTDAFMIALVTGAAGFLGSHLVRQLVGQGHEVRMFLRKTSDVSGLQDIKAGRAFGDVLDYGSVKEALKGCDTLFHVAGKVSSRKKDHKEMEAVNVRGTASVLRAARDVGVGKVVVTSSLAAVGAAPSGRPADETTPFSPEQLGVKYASTKYAAEQEALKFEREGLPVVIVNPSVAIGPGDTHLASNGFIVRFCQGKIPGYIDCGFNVVDVEDVAQGHILAAEKGRSGERYILGHTNLTMKALFGLLEKVTGVPAPKKRIPLPAARLLGFFSERVLDLSFPNFSSLDVESVKLARFFWYCDSSKAVRELGFPQTPLEQTLEKTVKWFRDRGLA
jgi:dihydroflavonol-4-reductase